MKKVLFVVLWWPLPLLAGPDQPWNDGELSGTGSGGLLILAAIVALYFFFQSFPRHTVAFAAGVLSAYVTSLLLGDALGLIVGCVAAVWILRI